jgi:hypothetical protein
MLTISIPRPILEGMFDQCERYREEETGGALLGFYSWKRTDLHIDVRAVIGAGPNARRSAVCFFKDGEYQEQVFRAVEKKHPSICHLGNWHTHHCNGLRTLSQGDVHTYVKCVNSPNHATDFWYALLVTHGTPNERMRYAEKHFVFVRFGGDNFVEVPASQVNTTGCEVLKL